MNKYFIQLNRFFTKINSSRIKVKTYLTLVIAAISFNIASAQILIDNTATGTIEKSKTLTINHTVSPGLNNSVVVVSLLITGHLNKVEDITYDGVDLTLVESSTRKSQTIAVYTLINPPVGTNVILINSKSKLDITLAATSFGNVNQSNIFSSIQSDNGDGKKIKESIDCDAGSFAMDFIGLDDEDGNEDSTQTLLYDALNANGDDYFYSSYKIASSGTDELKWKFKDTDYNYIWGCLNAETAVIPMIDFDGVDDYLSTNSVIDGLGEVTLMVWVKSDSGNNTRMYIAGEDDACSLILNNGSIPVFTIRTAWKTVQSVGGCSSCNSLNYDEWHHLAGTFSNVTGILKLYIDGVLVDSKNTFDLALPLEANANANNTFEVGRFSNTLVDNFYFKGDIDEVRVFDKALSESQLQEIVFQEIENNSGNVKGSEIDKDVKDFDTGENLLWGNLKLYYKMGTDFTIDDKVIDYSGNDNAATTNNITSWQEETAPMPFVTVNDGSWTNESTWLHGDVWDIENNMANGIGVIQIKNNISITQDLITTGLIIDSGKTLTVNGDNQVYNSWYLELNGTLDLMDDSQLIQGTQSDLVTSVEGKLLRRQEGTTSPYRYNYWSSPIGAKSVTTLIDNNTAINNPNNTDYGFNLLNDETGADMPITANPTANGNISSVWLYSFINGVTYDDWNQLNSSSSIKPGVGYTQKGTGNTGSEQQYIFEGKPNNGTILIDGQDVGGDGSVTAVTKTSYLLGNPYPSAIDLHKFIDDNADVIDGTIQLWQQWSGNSHYLNEYEGGYAQVNKTGSIRAFQFMGKEGANTGVLIANAVKPSRYLPVGQGFVTEIKKDGKVEFNNNQRVFIKEADADGTYDNGSTFFKGNSKSESNAIPEQTTAFEFQKIRLELKSVNGPNANRELLLGFSTETTDGYDYGYDAENAVTSKDDIHLNLEGKDMNIQAYSEITADKVIALNFKSSGKYMFEIKITETENIAEDQAIFLKDNVTGKYFDLTQKTAYGFTSEAGKFNRRFEIVFKGEYQEISPEEEVLAKENHMYYKNTTNTLFVKKLNSNVSKLSLINMRGQVVLEMGDVSTGRLENGIQFNNVSSGAYVVWMRTEASEVLTKKIIVK